MKVNVFSKSLNAEILLSIVGSENTSRQGSIRPAPCIADVRGKGAWALIAQVSEP